MWKTGSSSQSPTASSCLQSAHQIKNIRQLYVALAVLGQFNYIRELATWVEISCLPLEPQMATSSLVACWHKELQNKVRTSASTFQS